MVGSHSHHDLAQEDDRALAMRAVDDLEAFATLYRRYVDVIYRYCFRRLGSNESAEDATQVVFEKALAAMPRYVPHSPFKSWLFTIAHNTVIDIARTPQSHQALDNHLPNLFDPQPSPEELTIALDQREQLRALIRLLPEREQRMIDLRIAGLNDKEISEVMGITHGAVRASQYRALNRLRQMMQDDRTPQAKALSNVLA